MSEMEENSLIAFKAYPLYERCPLTSPPDPSVGEREHWMTEKNSLSLKHCIRGRQPLERETPPEDTSLKGHLLLNE